MSVKIKHLKPSPRLHSGAGRGRHLPQAVACEEGEWAALLSAVGSACFQGQK